MVTRYEQLLELIKKYGKDANLAEVLKKENLEKQEATMRNIVEAMIEKLEYFDLKEEADFFREETETELSRNDFPDNQYLWSMIKDMAERLEQYTTQN